MNISNAQPFKEKIDLNKPDKYFYEAIENYQSQNLSQCIDNLKEYVAISAELADADSALINYVNLYVAYWMLRNIVPIWESIRSNYAEKMYSISEQYPFVLGESLAVQENFTGKEHPIYAKLLELLGDYYSIDDYEKAEKLFIESIKVIGNDKHHFPPYRKLAQLYIKMQNLTKAIEMQVEADKNSIACGVEKISASTELWRMMFGIGIELSTEKSYALAFAFPADLIVIQIYNNTLFLKNLQLVASNKMKNNILSSKNQELIDQYEKNLTIRRQNETEIYNNPFSRESFKADSLDKIIVMTSSASNDIKTDLELDWNDVQAKLSPNDIAIEFVDFFIPEKDSLIYAALILKKDWPAPKMIPLFEKKQFDNIDTKSEDSKVIAKHRYSSEIGKAEEISALIWQPLSEYLSENDNVFFSPSGVLHQLAIESLPLEDGRLASEKYNLYRLSSTKQLCYEHPEKKYNKVVLYGGLKYDLEDEIMVAQSRAYTENRDHYSMRGFESDSAYRSGWEALSGAKKEVENIASTLRQKGIHAVVFEEEKGNEESFRTLSGEKYDIIHIATHGFFLPLREARKKEYFTMMGDNSPVIDNSMNRAGLILSGGNKAWRGESIPDEVEDGVLTAQEITTLDLRDADLVVLSACETGLGEVSGEGVFGLQRAFKKAGAQTLIMTLWKVHDEATQFMMSKFYSHLLSGNSKREAFLKAQAATKAKYTNPFYWAGFIMLD